MTRLLDDLSWSKTNLLIKLSSKDIDKMVSDQFKGQNDLNYKANEA